MSDRRSQELLRAYVVCLGFFFRLNNSFFPQFFFQIEVCVSIPQTLPPPLEKPANKYSDDSEETLKYSAFFFTFSLEEGRTFSLIPVRHQDLSVNVL